MATTCRRWRCSVAVSTSCRRAPGGGFAALLLAMLLAGLNYANSLALLLTFALGGFAIVGDEPLPPQPARR